jgi:hypothetical protein
MTGNDEPEALAKPMPLNCIDRDIQLPTTVPEKYKENFDV